MTGTGAGAAPQPQDGEPEAPDREPPAREPEPPDRVPEPQDRTPRPQERGPARRPSPSPDSSFWAADDDWGDPQSRTRRRRGALVGAIALVAVGGILLGLDIGLTVRSASSPQAARTTDRAGRLPLVGGSGVTVTSVPTAVPDAPQPAPDPVAKVDDLNRLCDGSMYFPTSPRRTGPGPHPVALFSTDGVLDVWAQRETYYYDEGLSTAVQRVWAPSDPRTVQVIGCLERTGAGSKLHDCRFDDPKPMTVPMLRASWRLRVYEAATGRGLLDRTLVGDDQSCPSLVLLGRDRTVYAGVRNSSVLAALRPLVSP